MNEDLNTQISQILADAKTIIDNQNKILSTVPNAEVLKNELSNKVNNDEFKPILDAINLHLNNTNFAENGYTKLPNGLILQWGVTTSSQTLFPVAFPNKCLAVSANTVLSTYVAMSVITSFDNVKFIDNSHYLGNSWTANSSIKKSFFAIGY